MDKKSQLRQHEAQELVAHEHTRPQTGREFATPEDLLRYDAAQTEAPATLKERLEQSLAQEPKPVRSWWQRLLGR